MQPKIIIALYKKSPINILIDEIDLHLITKIHVNKQKNNKLRVMIWISNEWKYLHRVILNVKDSKTMVDHIDGNPLNNSRANLRLASYSQNSFNRGKTSLNTSGYKGIWKRNDGRLKCWVAEISYNNKNIKIGSFYTKEEAAIAYNKKAVELDPNFSLLNEIERSPNET